MADFKKFSKLVESQFDTMSKGELYKVDITKDELWDIYLGSFPEGTNPLFRVRTEHDCSCCRQFVKNVANVVAIKNGQMVTVWDVAGAEYPYDVVAAKMAEVVKDRLISNVFRTSERSYSSEVTRELTDDKSIINWNHFHCKVASAHYSADVGALLGRYTSTAQVFQRGLDELRISDLNTVKDLITSNSLYRGEEFLATVKEFSELKAKYNKLNSPTARNLFVWENIGSRSAGFRNTVIGTLVQDLTAGDGLEKAVASFEAKVAPTNYKRTKALITPSMVKDAMKTIEDIGLKTALDRRFARISDVSVNNVLFVDNSVQAEMKDGIESLLMAAASKNPKVQPNAIDIDIEKFMSTVVPHAISMEVLVKNHMQPNFVSLTAPVHEDVNRLFKWDNNFAWSYNGNITDSIKEKVKRAGGNINATMRVSLSWFNYDDLDIHVYEPDGTHIYFGNKCNRLDVDMNAGGKHVRDPVENVSWPKSVPDGKFKVSVNNFAKRETSDVGFVLEVENNGITRTYSYNQAVTGTVPALEITVRNNMIIDVVALSKMTEGHIGQESWNVKTEELVPVNVILNSPNYWDNNATGNRHWFFILKDCKNPDPTRGIYNEFLRPELEKHRKVFEILGDKTKCPVVDDQLSGVGFSSTKQDTATIVVKDDTTQRTYNVKF